MSIIEDASNIVGGDNPPYSFNDFIQEYPQFGPNSSGKSLIPQVIVEKYVKLAHASIKEARWGDMWDVAIGWFIAHFCTLYIQGTTDPNSGAGAALEAGRTKGLDTSVSAGGVSVSTDYGTISQSLDSWGSWNLTFFGQQLATMAKLVGLGGMYVY